MAVLILIEHNNQNLYPASLSCITAGLKLAPEVDVIIFGFECDKVVDQLSKITGVRKIYFADDQRFSKSLAEDIYNVVKNLAQKFSHIIAPASTFGKNCLPRLASHFDVQPITDVLEIKNENTFIRPIYAGNALATVESSDAVKLITVRPTSFEAAKTGDATADVEKISLDLPAIKSEFLEQRLSHSDRPELGSAKIVISGGRGLQDAEQFKVIEKLADRLGAAVGASRAAVDAGFVPNDYQVGQTGKVIAPELYIAIGISGAIQHVAGIKDSKVIVAINKDPDAPIFDIADYGLVADFFEILPEFETELDKLGYK